MSCFHRAGWVLLLLSLFACGCASVPNEYIPSVVGSLGESETSGPIEARINAAQDRVSLGDQIFFSVTIRNRGADPIWLPRDPDVLLTWIYPNGEHDNFLREFASERFYDTADAVLLRPGHQMVKTIIVKTYFFPKPGITEFRAQVHMARNTNPELRPFWVGDLESNAYGVMVDKPILRSARR
ncbi:MAG: hypothetical protein BWY59_00113 [Verrucomicrobia bacterium ADurb.Bin345]|nr:MAG: hypothetical protein BWY59_00113 [Verrucomicrobia bacterium ADurb.Bin345]